MCHKLWSKHACEMNFFSSDFSFGGSNDEDDDDDDDDR